MDIISLWSLQFMMFFFAIAGMIMAKKGILTGNCKPVITDLVMDFILPCSIIKSFQTKFEISILKNFVIALAVATFVQIVSLVLSRILYNHKPDAIRRVLQYCTLVSNSGFLGLPIVQSIFGAEGLMYASVFIIPIRIVMWTAGISCFTEASDMKTVVKKLASHPCIVALYIGIPMLILQTPLNALMILINEKAPYFLSQMIALVLLALDKMISSAGSCTTPLIMILIGTMVAEIRVSDFLDKDCILITCMRQLILPGIVFAVTSLLHLDPLLRGISVLLTGMPAGSTSAILAAKYGCDYTFATKCVVVSTLISLLSIPIWCMVL